LVAAHSTPAQVVNLMVGRNLADLFQKEGSAAAPGVVLEVRGLSRTGTKRDASAIVLRDVSLRVHAGEIVGLAGLVGSGRTELARAIFGADRFDAGEILIDGEPVAIHTPQDAIRAGIGMVPEDRKLQALVLQLAVRENVSLPSLRRLSSLGVVRRPEERRLARSFVDTLQIRTPSLEQRVVNLSGGNQQKVVIAKWLALQPKILLVDEPTRGVDVGAKAEVHQLLSQLARRGVAILMISSELPEVLGMSDRILVMRAGTIAGELPRGEATQERIMALATGLGADQPAA
jgi:ABC-type sugar transport system ATPase subunit